MVTDEAFSDEDSEYPRQDRFKARREMINTMIQMGVAPTAVQFETPRGAINASKLKAMHKDPASEEGQKFTQIGQQFDRPPGTGKISGLVELARARGLVEAKTDGTENYKVIGKTITDHEISYPRYLNRPKDETND